MTDIDCVFRTNLQRQDGHESATCRLLQQLANLPEALCTVGRDVCLACVASPVDQVLLRHPVMASLVYGRCDHDAGELGSSPSDSRRQRLRRLVELSEETIVDQQDAEWDGGPLPACDVVLCCSDAAPGTQEAIESVLTQRGAVPILHLVDLGHAQPLISKYHDRWNVHACRLQPGTSPLTAVHEIVRSLRTPFVAIQMSSATSEPERLARAVGALMTHGAEIYASSADVTGGERLAAALPDSSVYRRYLPTDTLVFRLASFVDLGGVAERPDDDVEFVFRAACERRNFFIDPQPTVTLHAARPLPSEGPPPAYRPEGRRCLRHHARGFPQQFVACDAVVPFHGHLDYVREAVESLLEQEHAEVIIHLVDDASPEDTTQLLNRWKSHPRLRTYRNSRNVGQYTSFNNVSVCFETELAAVQDADDISLPHRMVTSGSLLYWTGGEFFGGAVEWFGADQRLKPVYHETKQRDAVPRRTHGWSHYAPQKQVVYFVENPTAMFRVELFRAKGGYADFGDPLANRASLDTEFLLRCRASGTHFAISREIVTRYRVHTESATQNSLTGWGTPARTKAIQQVDFRSRIYHRTSRFDPRLFGSLGRYADVTRRV